MKIERAHRTGAQQKNEHTPRPRNIVCKTVKYAYQKLPYSEVTANFKDRKTVKKQGYHLGGTSFFISEQFPLKLWKNGGTSCQN